MTIIEAVTKVLINHPEGLTSKEIYQKIVDENLYYFLAKNPKGVVNSTLRRHCYGIDFPTASWSKYFVLVNKGDAQNYYALFSAKSQKGNTEKSRGTSTKKVIESELLPEERIRGAYKQHLDEVKLQLSEMLQSVEPSFFEILVLQLLLKMGYGYDSKDSGVHTGRSHDGGIDGIIYEDKLGLSLIYIQAKRYKNSHKVNLKDVKEFVASMQKIQKRVFITTSSFTSGALEYAKEQQSLRLIDGGMLVDLMIQYELGVTSMDCVHMYKVDKDYFME